MGLLLHRFLWWLHHVVFLGMAVGDMALWLQFLVLFGSALGALWAIREAKRARDLQSTIVLIDELGSKEVRKARSWVLDNLPEDGSAKDIPVDGLEMAKTVAVAYDRVGFLIMQKLAPQRPFFEWQQDEIGRLWPRLEPIVTKEQTRRSHYCKHFKDLALVWLPKATAKHGGIIKYLTYLAKVRFDKITAKHRRHVSPAAELCPACEGKGIVSESANKNKTSSTGGSIATRPDI